MKMDLTKILAVALAAPWILVACDDQRSVETQIAAPSAPADGYSAATAYAGSEATADGTAGASAYSEPPVARGNLDDNEARLLINTH